MAKLADATDSIVGRNRRNSITVSNQIRGNLYWQSRAKLIATFTFVFTSKSIGLRMAIRT